MSYTVLARKYRPQTFADLVGQEHVSRTIGNAIASGRVAHAFLFTGARGVGKTTTARLLAKALCCEKGPTAEPCNVCDACREITNGTDLDVLEIDGASNNSVDDVRRLQETLPFRPARNRFKVVIVDEVHMLSTGAFNAFLKTLEEPPAHVKFIFATTEVHKVPVTIRSRCQRYDFRLIPHAVVSARVREILAREQISADDAAVAIVAREAAGSMRDALTVLDQLLALGSLGPESGGLKGEEVARGLGIASRKHVFGAVEALQTGDAATSLRSAHAIAEQGLDVLHFARQLLELARDLVVLRVVGDDLQLVDLVEDERVDAQRIANAVSKEELERTFAGLSKLVEDVGKAGTPQIVLEMGLVRLADRPPLLPLRELLDRLRALEEKLGTSTGPSGPTGGGGGGGERRFVPPMRTQGSSAPAPGPRMDGPRGPGPVGFERRTNAAVAVVSALPTPQSPEQPSVLRSAPSVAPQPATVVAMPAAAPTSMPNVAPPSAAVVAMPQAAPISVALPKPAVAPPAAFSTAPVPPASAAPAAPAPSSAAAVATDAHGAWAGIVALVKSAQPALAAVLEHGMPIEVSARVLRIDFPDGSFFGRQAQSTAGREALTKAAEQVLGARPELTFGARGPTSGEAKVATLAELADGERKARKAEKVARALAHPRVQDALEVFEETEGNVDVQVETE